MPLDAQNSMGLLSPFSNKCGREGFLKGVNSRLDIWLSGRELAELVLRP